MAGRRRSGGDRRIGSPEREAEAGGATPAVRARRAGTVRPAARPGGRGFRWLPGVGEADGPEVGEAVGAPVGEEEVPGGRAGPGPALGPAAVHGRGTPARARRASFRPVPSTPGTRARKVSTFRVPSRRERGGPGRGGAGRCPARGGVGGAAGARGGRGSAVGAEGAGARYYSGRGPGGVGRGAARVRAEGGGP